MKDDNTEYPSLRRPGRLQRYPFMEIQDFDEEIIEQNENEDSLQW